MCGRRGRGEGWNGGLEGDGREERGRLGVGDCVSIADIASAVSLVLVA